MQRSPNVQRVPAAICLTAAVTTLIMISAALPALADGDTRGPEAGPPTPLIQDPFGDFGAPGHRGKLELPRALTGNQSADAPKFSFEFGYGAPPLASSPSFINGALGGRTELRSVKAGVTFSF